MKKCTYDYERSVSLQDIQAVLERGNPICRHNARVQTWYPVNQFSCTLEIIV